MPLEKREGFMPARYLQRVGFAAVVPSTAAKSTGTDEHNSSQFVVVGATGGNGVFLRPQPIWSTRWPALPGENKDQGAWWHHGWVAWLDGTELEVRGPNVTWSGPLSGSEEPWVPVRDPSGREGYVPQRFTKSSN